MHGANGSSSSGGSSVCCVCLIVHSRRHLMPRIVCVCVCVRVCACAATACQSWKSSEPDEMTFNMQLNLICPNSSISCSWRHSNCLCLCLCMLHTCRRNCNYYVPLRLSLGLVQPIRPAAIRIPCSSCNRLHAPRLCVLVLAERTPLPPSKRKQRAAAKAVPKSKRNLTYN